MPPLHNPALPLAPILDAASDVAAAAALPGADANPQQQRLSTRMPVVFLPHGGGPWPFVDLGFGEAQELEALATWLRGLKDLPKIAPQALLVISAHWEEDQPTVTTSTNPPLLFDYYGFPPAAYRITWPAPGNPTLALRVRALLEGAGFSTGADNQRGFDHGTFVPLKLSWPEAEVPVVQLSLVSSLDPALHLALGRALAPLRDEGIFMIGSGMSYHNLGAFSPRSAPVAEAFDSWLGVTTTSSPAARDQRLVAWTKAPSARMAHPRAEHLLPLMVVAGAAGDDVGHVCWKGTFAGLRISACLFG